MLIDGDVLRDDRHATDYRNYHAFTTPAIRFHPKSESSEDKLVSFTVDDLILTSGFIPIDVARRRMFMHHTYARIETLNQLRFHVDGSRFTYGANNLKRHAGPCVILGGSIDGNWYHWLLNWCLRLVIIRRLRPDLLADDRVRLVVDSAAAKNPYRAIVDAFAIPEHRLLFVDRTIDHRFEDATVTSFCDDQKLYPELIREFSAALLAGLGVVPRPGGRRIFASRQGLAAPKRRIHNFAELDPVLRAHGFDILQLGDMSAHDQAQTFHDAELVVGAHGSDLTNIIFCRPRTRVMVFENRGNVIRGLHLALRYLAEVMDLDYTCVLLPSAAVPAQMQFDRLAFFHADYIVDAPAFSAEVTNALSGQRERWASSTVAGTEVATALPRHRRPVQDLLLSYAEPVDWMPILFLPDAARREGTDILSTGRTAGYFTDGPHEMLEAGDYRIRLTLSLEGEAVPATGNDVLCEAVIGRHIRATRGLRLTRNPVRHTLVLRVPAHANADVDEELDLFSLRLRTLHPAGVRLSGLTVQRLSAPPPHCETVSEGFILEPGAPEDCMPLLLLTPTSFRREGEILTTGEKAGYFTDGPHEMLEPGDYRIRIALSRENGDPRPLGYDAYCEAVVGGRVIGTKGLKLTGGPDEHELILRIPSQAMVDRGLFNLRLRTLDPVEVRLSSLTIERLPAPPDEAHGIEKGFIVPFDDADWLPCMEVHEIGYPDGADRCSRDQRPGYFLDGPHELLPEGDYRFAITLGLEPQASRKGANVVVCEAVQGSRVLMSRRLKLGGEQDTHRLDLRLPRYGDDGTQWFALRLRTVKAQAVRVTRLRAWSLPHMSQEVAGGGPDQAAAGPGWARAVRRASTRVLRGLRP